MAIEDILMYDESLFQNINAFDPDYMPQNYNFRDTQMEAMAMSIRPAIRGGQPSNAIVLGSPATGKTTPQRHPIPPWLRSASPNLRTLRSAPLHPRKPHPFTGSRCWSAMSTAAAPTPLGSRLSAAAATCRPARDTWTSISSLCSRS